MRNLKDIGAWIGRSGSFSVAVPARQVRGIIVTDGASLRAVVDGSTIVLASGRGKFDLDFVFPMEGELQVVADHADVETAVHLSGWGPREPVLGWTEGESFTQLELKEPSDVPSPIRAMMERMQANAIKREMQLRAEIESLKNRNRGD